jgi:hypothetical protein
MVDVGIYCMEMKGALSMTRGNGDAETPRPEEDIRYYFSCPLRKNRARIPVTVCRKQKCMFLGSKDGKPGCSSGDLNAPK